MTQVLNPSGAPAVLNVDATGALKIAGGGGGGGSGSIPTGFIRGNLLADSNSESQCTGWGMLSVATTPALPVSTWTTLHTFSGKTLLHLLAITLARDPQAGGTLQLRLVVDGVATAGVNAAGGSNGSGYNLVGRVNGTTSATFGNITCATSIVVQAKQEAVAEPANFLRVRALGWTLA